jgi:YjbE family integral membrane protein
MDLASPGFWAALGSIILTNIVLSGDNAVVIALAARALPRQHQRKAIVWGSALAVVMRVLLTLVAVKLLELPYLKLVGGVLLLYVGVQLLLDEEDEEEHGTPPAEVGVWMAVRMILVADVVMSLDNVLAVAAAAHNDLSLLVIGLGLSVPLIVFGSTLLLKVMQRWPLIVTAGGGLLGYLAGGMLSTDPVIERWLGSPTRPAAVVTALAGTAFVLLASWLLRRRHARRDPSRPIGS